MMLLILPEAVKREIKRYVKRVETSRWKWHLGTTGVRDESKLPILLEEVGLTPAQQGELVRMNDDGASFEHIAKFIKTEYRSA